MSNSLQVVNFHNHYVGPGFPLNTLTGLAPAQHAFWEAVNKLLRDPSALLSSLEQGGVVARVLNTPLEFIQDPEGKVPTGTVQRINDALADLVQGQSGRLFGLATVDAYAGESAAAELSRAVKTLGLRGVFVESAKGPLLPDAMEARPTFAAAAALGVPVFLHPVADRDLDARFKRFGPLGVRLTRSTVTSAALVAILQSGMFEELPGLRIVVTALALGGVLIAAGMPDGSRLRKDTPSAVRRHVYIDTTGMNAAAVRTALDIVGADHVVAGTDWPVVQEKSLPFQFQQILAACSLSAEEQHMVTRTNALRLLGITPGGVS